MQDNVTYIIPDDVRKAFKDLRLKRKYRWIVIGVSEKDRKFFLEHGESNK